MDKEKITQIAEVEKKYGFLPFRMGLAHLADVGRQNLDDDGVAEAMKQIVAKDEESKANDVVSIMTVEFQFDLVRCAAELAKFDIWDLFAYIKECVTIGTNEDNSETCPHCENDELEHEAGRIEENDCVYKWSCEECGAKGRTFYNLVFSEHIVDVEGEE